MLTFINSTILIALPAIVIPILIHMFNKQRKKRVQFSSTIFLKMLCRYIHPAGIRFYTDT